MRRRIPLLICIAILGLALVACRGSEKEKTWTVRLPTGLSFALSTEARLSERYCTDCVVGYLTVGTKILPTGLGCRTAEWDEDRLFCHVQVLSGEYEGRLGWLDDDLIER